MFSYRTRSEISLLRPKSEVQDILRDQFVGRCGVVGGTLAFGSLIRSWVRIRAPLIFTSRGISLQQAEITGEVLTGRFSSSTAAVHSASYPPGRAINRVAAYQW